MFEVELLNLINQAKSADNEKKINDVKGSICNLIVSHKDEFDNFIQKNNIDENTRNFLLECKEEIENKEKSESASKATGDNDFEILRDYYKRWLNFYRNNNQQVEENCNKIVDEIINFYVLNRFDVIEEILQITDTQDYEAFKWHIKNKLRIYFVSQIRKYLNSDNYKDLNFFKKLRKKHELEVAIREISKYNFNKKFIDKVIEK